MAKALMLLFPLYFLPLFLSAADVAGQWNFHATYLGEDVQSARIHLKTEGSHVTGNMDELVLDGTLQGNRLQLKATRPDGKDWGKLEGQLQGDDLTGTVRRGEEEFAWKAHRTNAAASPQTRTFEPQKFQRLFSGRIDPVLQINPGDTVRTKTVDAGGKDLKGVRRSLGGNPETGPFYVEGAMPGDTLVVKLLRVRLNRDSAESGNRIVASALSPDYYRDAKFSDEFGSDWKLDRERGTGALAKPTERLKNFRVQLQPMLGCIGVAPPANQAFRAGWLGSWGGNMDYSGVREGTTVYLPVYREGALLFIGDGHALEGDGELNGDALETSMDVEFTVDLVRGKSTQAPRFESEEFLMASGIGGSLQEALQQATTELARWIERDYKLSANESNLVLGTSIRYDVAELVDPQVHIVAKVSKAVLAGLR